MTAPIAGNDNLACARRIARVYGNTPVARELAAMLGLADDSGYIRADDRAEYLLGFSQPKVGKRAAIEHPHAMDARPKVSTAPEALRNLPDRPAPPVQIGRLPLTECPSKPARKRHRRNGQSCAICGVSATRIPRGTEKRNA